MANIHVLDPQTANLIAAGEVVERPANVIKELLENAIDAKSRAIETEIEGGGVDLIRVTDNGGGMDREDLALCVKRHATSKIRSGADLAAIGTLGFRGEALAAISATSRFTILSKKEDSPLGHQITLEGEEVLSLEECGSANGTTVLVRDLFFNQPARRKFLKRAQTEAGAILQYIQRIAVSHPEISFRHIADGEVKLSTPGNGNLADCIWSVYGGEFAKSLVEVEYRAGDLSLSGFITRPELARHNHNYQSFYINGRFVKSRTVQFALEDAYKSFVKSEKFPGCVLFLNLPTESVDVNVHPAKLEVRFAEERLVYETVYEGIRKTLSRLSNQLARDEFRRAEILAQGKPEAVLPKIGETKPPLTPSKEVQSGTYREAKSQLPLFAPAHGEKSRVGSFLGNSLPAPKVTVERVPFYKTEEKTVPQEVPSHVEPIAPPKPEVRSEEPMVGEQLAIAQAQPEKKEHNPLTQKGVLRGAIFHAFLLYETEDTLYLIDKHAAHERILYEALKKHHTEMDTQLLLEPVAITLSPMEFATLTEHLEELEKAGFLLEEFGQTTLLLRGIPQPMTKLSGDDLKRLLQESAGELQLGGKAQGARDKLFDRTLYSMACKAAVKAGIPSTESDHNWLVEALKEIDNITVCPHGRPVMVAYTRKQIEALFLRT